MNDQKSILHVISNAPPLFGGAAQQAFNLSENLLNVGIDSEFISIDDVNVKSDSLKIKRIEGGGIGGFVAIYKYIRQINPQVVMIHGGVRRLIILTLLLPSRFKIFFKITTDAEIKKINESNLIRTVLDYRGVFVANITNIPCKVSRHWFICNIPRKLFAGGAEVIDAKYAGTRFVVIGAICARKRTLQIIRQFLDAKMTHAITSDCCLYFYGPYDSSFAEYEFDYIKSVLEVIRDRDDIQLIGKVDLSKIEFPKTSILVHSAESEGCPNSVLEFLYLEKPVLVSSNLRQNFPFKLQPFVNFVDQDNLFAELKKPANGAKQVLDELKNNYLSNIKCVVYSLQ